MTVGDFCSHPELVEGSISLPYRSFDKLRMTEFKSERIPSASLGTALVTYVDRKDFCRGAKIFFLKSPRGDFYDSP